MGAVDIAAIEAAQKSSDPFDHVIVPGVISSAALADIHKDFPKIDRPGSFPLASLSYGPGFASLLEDLRGPAFARAVGGKLGLALEDKPTMVTVRGRCRQKDGQIHIDSGGKVVTVLIYMNASWEAQGGQLRLLRSADSLEDYAAEVPPQEGTMIAFTCTDNAWHGHHSFDGERRTIQLNWVASRRYMLREQVRHTVSAGFKKLFG